MPAGSERFGSIVANPPFIAGAGLATYSDGGDFYGAAVTMDWARASICRPADGVRCLFFTGARVISGTDAVREAPEDIAREVGGRPPL